MKLSKTKVAATALALMLAACSSEPSSNKMGGETANEAAPVPSAPQPAPSESPPPPVPNGNASIPPSLAASRILMLDGLGTLKIGQPVPATMGWGERGAQVSDACRTVTSPEYPGVYAIVEGGRVRRITVGQRSDVTLIGGIGVGATEKEVRAAFPDFRETPHKYVEAPGKYVTAPNAEGGDPALRFEIGTDGKVSLIHVGTMPVLGYVEGCA